MTLPLFPLNTVLFPGCTLDLQLFEARYLDMIGRCMKQGSGFGVVCLHSGEEAGVAADAFAQIGCEALVYDFQQQDNGLLGIRVKGGRRFKVITTEVQADQLIIGQVEWLEDLAEQPLEDHHQDLQALMQALAEHPMVASLDMAADVHGQAALANQLAYLLPFSNEAKVQLLGIDDPDERLDLIQTLLDELQGDMFA
ncbi:LON peptidase substrate-binding domain-containing protein [Pseudomonas sp. nanlin1]|uniref:LON peptidase substrate-binding domain-containing protein n=1 Tax=Pseudomonas sp. nanlin1 TaxID=3040605 RepID=UPI00388F7DC0